MTVARYFTFLALLLFADLNTTWTQSITSIVVGDSNRLYVCASETGILRSDDNGVHWMSINRNIPDSDQVNLLAQDARGILYAASGYSHVYASTNRGENWALAGTGLPPNAGSACLAADAASRLYFGDSHGLYRLAAPESTWTLVTGSLLFNPSVISMTITDTGRIVIGSQALGPNGNVPITYHSSDHGNTWARLDSGRLYYGLLHLGEDTLFAGGYHTGLFHSTNGGGTWSLLGIPESWIVSFTQEGRYIYVGSDTSQGVSRMVRSGDSLVSLFSSPGNVQTLAVGSDSTILAGTSSGLYRSSDHGATWIPVLVSPTSVEAQSGSYPETFSLEQNYPNPFNATTIIRFHLPAAADLRLTIVDVLGREISTLRTGLVTAGTHEIPFNANTLASGVYFCQAQYGSTIRIIRMVLMK